MAMKKNNYHNMPTKPNNPKAIKQKKCRICKELFTPFRALQIVCSPTCAQQQAAQSRLKKEAKELRERKEKARPLSWYEDRAQTAVNAYVVHGRDKDEGCISCGTRNPNIIYAAGHFRTRKAASQLRYNLDNLHKQCNFHCNAQLSGNIQNYRPALIAKIGQERFDALINNNESHRYTIEELEEITQTHRRMLKELIK